MCTGITCLDLKNSTTYNPHAYLMYDYMYDASYFYTRWLALRPNHIWDLRLGSWSWEDCHPAYICACVHVCMCACVHVCMCVRERERENLRTWTLYVGDQRERTCAHVRVSDRHLERNKENGKTHLTGLHETHAARGRLERGREGWRKSVFGEGVCMRVCVRVYAKEPETERKRMSLEFRMSKFTTKSKHD